MLSNHLQIVLNEIAPVIPEDYEIPPKIGDKYYIEPTRKAQLEAVELDLRNKILQFSQKNPLGSFSVNLDHITKEIVVITENEQFNSEIEEIISQYPEDVSIVFSNGGRNPAFCAILSTRFLIEDMLALLRICPSFLKIGSFGSGVRPTSLPHTCL